MNPRKSSRTSSSEGASAGPRRGVARAKARAPRRRDQPAPVPRRRDEARALFRNAILDAAEEVFFDRGFHGARIQDIAARAGTAVGTIYNHLGQKEDVMRALLEERTSGFADALAPVEGEPRSFEAKLTARLERLLRYMAQHRGFLALASEHGLLGNASAVARQILGPKPLRHVERFRAAMRELVREGVAAGALAPLDPDLLARFLGGSIKAVLLHTGYQPSEERAHTDAATVAAFFVHGARPRVTKRKPSRARR